MVSESITLLLNRWSAKDPAAAEQLFDLIYPEMRRLAKLALLNEWGDRNWHCTALVNEAVVSICGELPESWANRTEFFSRAITVMRRILIQDSRRRRAQKRWGGLDRIELDEDSTPLSDRFDELAEIAIALDRLREADSRAAQVIELRFFLGLTNEETSQALGISLRSVERDFEFSRAVLRKMLG